MFSPFLGDNKEEFFRESIMPREDDEREQQMIYRVVVNHEEQYSIWPAHKENAPGWKDAGKSGAKDDCLAYIKEVWTDMRPLSLRKKMEESSKNRS
jgi:MbtH protein